MITQKPNRFSLRLLAALIAVVLATPAAPQELGPPLQLPEHIEYKAASESTEKVDAQLLTELLEGQSVISLPTAVGPFLTTLLNLDELHIIPSTFIVPRVEGNIEGAGATIGEPESLATLSTLLAAQLPRPVTIRRPSLSEVEYYWAIAPFALEGSLLVSESDGRSLLWNFHPEGILLVEDVTLATGTIIESYSALLNLPKTTLESEPLPDFVTPLLNGEQVPEVLQDADKTDSPLVVFLTPPRTVEYRVIPEALVEYISKVKSRLQGELAATESERIFVQFDLVSDAPPRLYLGAQPGMSTESLTKLKRDLDAITLPEIKGPVRFLLVEMPAAIQ